MDNIPVKMQPLYPSAPPRPDQARRAVGSTRAQVDRALRDAGDPGPGSASTTGLAAAIRGLTEATRILADRLDELEARSATRPRRTGDAGGSPPD